MDCSQFFWRSTTGQDCRVDSRLYATLITAHRKYPVPSWLRRGSLETCSGAASASTLSQQGWQVRSSWHGPSTSKPPDEAPFSSSRIASWPLESKRQLRLE